MKAVFIRIGLYLALALLIPAVWHPAKTTATTQMAVIQPLPLPTEADPWHGMSDAERVRGDAEARATATEKQLERRISRHLNRIAEAKGIAA